MKEFTVILYAGGTNRLINDLSVPKALIPIGNRPLIWYSLQLIHSTPSLSSSPLIILTSLSTRDLLNDYLSTLNLSYEVLTYRQHHESNSGNNDDQQSRSDEFGTLDILRSCYSHIRTESICLLTCDLFGKIHLTPMINMFRVRDASLVMILLPTANGTGTSSLTSKDSLIPPGQKTRFTSEVEYYTIDPSTNTVTSIRLKSDLDEHLPLETKILIKYPRTLIRSDLTDAHFYLIKKSSLDVGVQSKCSSFRKEFLPEMIRQLAIGQPLEDLLSSTNNHIKAIDRYKQNQFDEYADFSSIMANYQSDNQRIQRGCYYMISESQLIRVKHVLSYLEANRQASSLIHWYTNEDISYKDRTEPIQVSSDCVIGDGCDIGKRTTIKRTIIGKNCRIEEKCKILNCVLLENVHIKEGSNLHNSIFCCRSTIGSKCEIQNSIICFNQQIEMNKKINGETISSHANDAELFVIDDDQQ